MKLDWEILANQFGYKILRQRPTQATVEAQPETITALLKDHPEIQVTAEKEYHTL